MSSKVLVIDDEQAMCELMQAGLKRHGCEVQWTTESAEALELVRNQDFDVVVTDLNLGQASGLDICKHITQNRPDTPVIVITAFGNLNSAVAAIRVGAYDFVTKPISVEALALSIHQAVQHRHLREEVKRLTEKVCSATKTGDLVGQSPVMSEVHDMIARVSKTDASVLLSGESGTGKELVARALHAQSDRSNEPFVAINCAAVPANLLESELFGHMKGAFTDARNTRKGLFEEAKGGTLLLDEIGEMPMEMQPKLLRVLQERTVRPVGGNIEIPIDVRVLAATNRDLETEVEEGRFREDLYYRLNVVQIHVPPLRARGNDILLLAQHFVEKSAQRLGKAVQGISSEAAKKLLEYDWPGNVRQLENSMERAVTLTQFEQITVDDLSEKIKNHESSRVVPLSIDSEHILTLQELEKRYIERVISEAGGNKTLAAKLLGLDRRTLYRKLERYQTQAKPEQPKTLESTQ